MKALYEEGLRLRRGLGDTAGAAGALHNLGHLAMLQGDYAQATRLLKESLALFQVVQDKNAIAIALHNLGLTALEQHDTEQAERLLVESLGLFWNTGDKVDLAEGLEGLASIAGARQQPERAARLWGAAESLRVVVGAPLSIQSISLSGQARSHPYPGGRGILCSSVERGAEYAPGSSY